MAFQAVQPRQIDGRLGRMRDGPPRFFRLNSQEIRKGTAWKAILQTLLPGICEMRLDAAVQANGINSVLHAAPRMLK